MKQRCYFHKNQTIKHFCSLKQCTLPLCDECLEIHQQQHLQKNQTPNIISYQEAYEEVYKSLQNFVQNNQKLLRNYIDDINKDKREAIQALERYFAQFESKIEEESKYFAQIQQKLQKLKKGSIKTVIYYFSGDVNLRSLQFPQFNQIIPSLQRLIKDLQNTKKKKQQIQTFRMDKVSESQLQEVQIKTYESKTKFNSRKKQIFSNQKYPITIDQTNTHKNTNEPYMQQLKKEQHGSPNLYQKERLPTEQQKSEVKNYFQQYNFDKRSLSNFKINEPKPSDKQSFVPQKNVLRETPPLSNLDYRNLRSKTFDKYPSMAELRVNKQNKFTPLSNELQSVKFSNPPIDFRPGKWSKIKQDVPPISYDKERPQSRFSQFTNNDPYNQSNRLETEFVNRKPLKTTDLQTYNPPVNPLPPKNITPSSIQTHQRTGSFEVGLRTTMSHNNLQLGKKIQPLLSEDMKKQVLSPLEIRKMLQKKIEERNKILIQKKEHQLKINTDRVQANPNTRADTRAENGKYHSPFQKTIGKENILSEELENIRRGMNSTEQTNNMYNTKDTIINQIYRQTKY